MERRSFLGAIGAIFAAPVVGQIVPATPGRGMPAGIFHVDEAAFFPVIGKPGQVLVSMGSGKNPEWQDPPQNYILSGIHRKQGPIDTSTYVQVYAIPLHPVK